MEPFIVLAFGILLLVMVPIAVIREYHRQKRDWNQGFCADCSECWRSFDIDSQGGRGYKCGCRHIWIDYPVDRKRLAAVKASY